MTDDTVELITELAKAMAIEAAARACYQANLEDKTTVTLDHVECTLPQLVSPEMKLCMLKLKLILFQMLDFP